MHPSRRGVGAAADRRIRRPAGPIIAETEPRILAVSTDFLDSAVESVLAGFAPQRLVVFDYEPRDDDQRDRFEAARRRLADTDSAVVVETLSTVIDRAEALAPAPLFVSADGEDPLVTLFYTSGSTGSRRAPCTPRTR